MSVASTVLRHVPTAWYRGCRLALVLLAGGVGCPACSLPSDDEVWGRACGPQQAEVLRVVDGDTLELVSGDRVRYLLIDAPEDTSEQECWGVEATLAHRMLVERKVVQLTYGAECRDRYGRLLAYVKLEGRLVNELLVERGHACVFPFPSEQTALEALLAAEQQAAQAGRGLWSACAPIPC